MCMCIYIYNQAVLISVIPLTLALGPYRLLFLVGPLNCIQCPLSVAGQPTPVYLGVRAQGRISLVSSSLIL